MAKIILVQGYNGSLLVFNNDDDQGWRGKVQVFSFYAGSRRRRTVTALGMKNAGEVKRLFRLSNKLREPYDEVSLSDDKGLLFPPPPKRRRRAIRRGVLKP